MRRRQRIDGQALRPSQQSAELRYSFAIAADRRKAFYESLLRAFLARPVATL